MLPTAVHIIARCVVYLYNNSRLDYRVLHRRERSLVITVISLSVRPTFIRSAIGLLISLFISTTDVSYIIDFDLFFSNACCKSFGYIFVKNL